MLAAKIERGSGRHESPAVPASVHLHQLLPVLRVDSREAAREFYAGILGFNWDWGSEEGEGGRAFYGQVSRGELQMHLTTEPLGEDHPVADVYFRMEGIDALYRELRRKIDAAQPLDIRDTFYDARELAVEDPFGNLLRFVEVNPPGVSGR